LLDEPDRLFDFPPSGVALYRILIQTNFKKENNLAEKQLVFWGKS
jgi:hypothetical protein